MNCTSRIRESVLRRPRDVALWTPSGTCLTFGALGRMVAGVQRTMHDEGVEAGDAVLLLGRPGPRLFAATLGLLGSGVAVILAEPGLPAARMDEMIRRLRPRAFVASSRAHLWSIRIPAIREIAATVPLSRIAPAEPGTPFRLVELDPGAPGTITLGTGTTGSFEAVLRSHECLTTLLELDGCHGDEDTARGPELCIHPYRALLGLAAGRGALLFPSRWTRRAFRRAAAIAGSAGPSTLRCGPGFLVELLAYTDRRPGTFTSLRQITVNGAQVDCDLLDRAFRRWPDARWLRAYGGCDEEPVAITDARDSVRSSRGRGLFQALYLGTPIPGIETQVAPSGLWVRGPHVARRFEEWARLPPLDSGSRGRQGDREWHSLGDRIEADVWGWWFGGRALQPKEEFCLEQRLYTDLGTSTCFVSRDPEGRLFLYGDALPPEVRAFRRSFQRRYPEICGVRQLRILRDRQTRSHVDRGASLRRAGWLS